MAKDYGNPWSMGEHFAGLAFDQINEDSPSLPRSEEEAKVLVDRITPDAMHDIASMAAQKAGGPIAMPKDVVAAIEAGFRHKLAELLSEHL